MWLRPLQPPQGECPLPFEPYRRDDPSRTLGQGLPAPVTPGPESDPLSALSGKGNSSAAAVPLASLPGRFRPPSTENI